MNGRFEFPMRCDCVRQLCQRGSISQVEEFLHSSFNIPVHYDVYGEFSGLIEYCDLQDVDLLAARYIVLDKQFNSDGIFGEVLCAYDLVDCQYVALKRMKEPSAFS